MPLTAEHNAVSGRDLSLPRHDTFSQWRPQLPFKRSYIRWEKARGIEIEGRGIMNRRGISLPFLNSVLLLCRVVGRCLFIELNHQLERPLP